MKAIKPDNMALSFKTQVLDDKDVFTVSAFATFSFDIKPLRLLDESILWEAAEANLEQDEILDFGSPKPRGEFLVYGSCFSANPVSGLGVQVIVGNMSKTLVVMGKRYWGKLGASDPVPFTQMSISYHNAFGGNGYANNPIGKGLAINDPGKIELPNIEDPKKPITQKSDRPEPVGFGAYHLMWPQRMQYMGKIDDNYIKDSWPHMPKGTNPEFFNTAPADQRLNGFFRGDENFSIKNMHKEKPVQNSKLPGLRARIFVVQKLDNDKEKFKELEAKAETLWLFPNHEIGALLYRANVEVIDDEYTDLDKLYAVWENMGEEPQSVEFYFTQMMNSINPPEDQAEAEVEPIIARHVLAEAVEVTPAVSPDVAVPQISQLDLEVEKSLKEIENFQAKMKDQLKKMNVANPDAVIEDQMAKLAATPQTPPPDMATVLKQMEVQNAELMQKFNVGKDDIANVIAKTNTPPAPLPPMQEAIEKMRKAGINDPEFEAKLTELDKLTKDIKAQIPEMNKAASEVETVAAITDEKQNDLDSLEKITKKTNEEPVLSAKDVTVEDVVRRYKINKDLSSMDLTNLDLSGMDLVGAVFSDSILDKTLFKQAKLDKAIFNSCRLDGTDFTDAALKSAVFNQSSGEAVKFNNADLTLAIFSDSNFYGSDFNLANLKELGINQTTFEESSFEGADAQKLTANRATFTTCDLTKANFTKASLVDSDISYSILSDANFTELYAPELKLAAVVGTSPCFKNAQLIKARANEETLLQKADFSDAVLSDAAWEGVKLPEANLSGAIMDGGNFSSGDFSRSSLELVSAKNANFSKGEFINSDLNRINLFQGSLRKARLSGANLSYSNLFGVDVYKAKFGNTNLIDANLKRTLFAALNFNPSSV